MKWWWFSGDAKLASGLQTYLLSRDEWNLKSEFQAGHGKVCSVPLTLLIIIYALPDYFFFGITKKLFLQYFVWQISVSCIEKFPAVTVLLGEHVHFTVGEYFLTRRNNNAWAFLPSAYYLFHLHFKCFFLILVKKVKLSVLRLCSTFSSIYLYNLKLFHMKIDEMRVQWPKVGDAIHEISYPFEVDFR